ncbi:hypothetical protein RJ639_018534 [Escallonia herrerae]|uniref:Pentatricopeptide repeat-containing protein n=1 Tax=Escallonia herrerae TaxID=1293975 RepID=A0AA89AJN3_9ASTE|nr:hypothetical protein RJ639_018534 [Escallonia herrerae]
MALCREGKVEEVLEFMSQGVLADYFTYEILLDSCGSMQSVELGKRVHQFLIRSSYNGDVGLSRKLMEMYVKCGCMRDARRVFDRLRERDLGCWHCMINGYVDNGQGSDGLALFEQMRKEELRLDGDSFVTVLSACASVGALEEGLMYFRLMEDEYGIVPGIEHYLGVIEVLGKAGHLDEAMEFVDNMPIVPTAGIWEALSSLARMQGNVELEDLAEELLAALEPSRAMANGHPTLPPKKHSPDNMLEDNRSLKGRRLQRVAIENAMQSSWNLRKIEHFRYSRKGRWLALRVTCHEFYNSFIS